MEEEKFTFKIRLVDEIDFQDNRAEPDEKRMTVLKQSTDALDMYVHHLPDSLGYDTYIKRLLA